ncbi:unnamed protein product [Clonostachys solani]|uniref:Uncharacterized protein n=1 Tax=Clonostachys solani TaxID=160281 RepID=A0A9P0EMB2_9HYPO|nr:unnamed protein product [Clonostachys solani]
MANDMLINGDDDSLLHVPTSMIWVCGRWTLIFHTDMESHDPAEVRSSFLNVLHLLDFTIFYPNCHNFPFFTLEQDGTFQPLVADFQYVAPNHLLVIVPGRQHDWLIEIPESPLRPVTSLSLSMFNASVPDDNNTSVGLSNVLDPLLLEGTHGQHALPEADVSDASLVCFKTWGAVQDALGDDDSMIEHDKLGLDSYWPTDSLMGQQSIELPECPPSTPVRLGSPETVYSESPPSDVSLEQCIEKLRQARTWPSIGSWGRGGRRLRPSCVSKKCIMPRPPARGRFEVSREDRFLVPFDRDLRDELLIRGRAMGFSYSEIKESACMPDALTTLRGRYNFLLRKMAQEELKKKKKRENKKDFDGKNKE